MGIALFNDVKQLVDHPNFAHLATLMSDGSPHSAPVWIGREDDLLLVCTEASSLKDSFDYGSAVRDQVKDFAEVRAEAS